MIINRENKVVVAVGEAIAYKGKVWRCAQDTESTPYMCEKHCSFHDFSLKHLCNMLECRFDERPDGLAVHFVPFGAEEGGENDNQ